MEEAAWADARRGRLEVAAEEGGAKSSSAESSSSTSASASSSSNSSSSSKEGGVGSLLAGADEVLACGGAGCEVQTRGGGVVSAVRLTLIRARVRRQIYIAEPTDGQAHLGQNHPHLDTIRPSFPLQRKVSRSRPPHRPRAAPLAPAPAISISISISIPPHERRRRRPPSPHPHLRPVQQPRQAPAALRQELRGLDCGGESF